MGRSIREDGLSRVTRADDFVPPSCAVPLGVRYLSLSPHPLPALFQVVSPPTDGVSALCWSPARAGSTSSFLVATSWDPLHALRHVAVAAAAGNAAAASASAVHAGKATSRRFALEHPGAGGEQHRRLLLLRAPPEGVARHGGRGRSHVPV